MFCRRSQGNLWEASFLIFMTLGSIRQGNTYTQITQFVVNGLEATQCRRKRMQNMMSWRERMWITMSPGFEEPCVAVCCSVLRWVAVCCIRWHNSHMIFIYKVLKPVYSNTGIKENLWHVTKYLTYVCVLLCYINVVEDQLRCVHLLVMMIAFITINSGFEGRGSMRSNLLI